MLRYALRKVLYLPFSLLLLSLVCFALSRSVPGDPVAQRLTVEGVRPGLHHPDDYANTYRRLAAEMGFDRPTFYFSVGNAVYPDTLYRIVPESHRALLRDFAAQYGTWTEVEAYYHELQRGAELDGVAASARRLLLRSDPAFIERELERLQDVPAADPLLGAYDRMVRNAAPYQLLVPRLTWNGTFNQFHRYLTALLRGDLGVSYADGRPVAGKIADALPVTARLNSVALLLVYLLAVPLGLYMARFHGTIFDRWATLITFIAFGLPSFWIATLLANFLTTPAFGMDWFPSMGLGYVPEDARWWERVTIPVSHLILPVFCLTYPSLAYVSRHLRSAALVELDRPYVRTAFMKGLSEDEVLWKHVFRNAAFPLITLLGGLLPGLLAGSVLIEQVFDLPGMGQLLYRSANVRDWPVVTALVLTNGVLTILGLLLADIGYAILDPRVRLGKLPPR